MIVENDSGYSISLRWNEYMQTYMADAIIDGKKHCFPIREGEYKYRDINVRVEVPDDCNRFDCDIKQSEIYFS